VGAAVAVLVMCLLPNAGSLGLTVSAAMIFGLLMLMLLDTSINMAMQPFKMLVGDMVNEQQKAKAYSIQSFLCNAGSVMGFVFPYFFAWIGIKKVAEKGVVPDSVIWSFYVGAAILILCVIYTTLKVKEWPPEEYEAYNGKQKDESRSAELKQKAESREQSGNWFVLLKHAPATFWKVGLVQFFCWAAFLYMWTYSTGMVAQSAIDTPYAQAISSYTDAEGNPITHAYVQYNNELIVSSGILKTPEAEQILVTPGAELQVATVMDEEVLSHPETYVVGEGVQLSTKRDIDVSSKEYGRAGDWVGVLFAIQAIGSVLWAMVIPLFKRRRKLAYSLSLIIGAIGFILTFFCTDTTETSVVIMNIPTTVAQLQLCGCYLLIGCAWAAMLAIPFTIVTNSIKEHMGSYLGLFNCSICLPQIVAAAVGGFILARFPEIDGVAQQPYMLVVAGVLLLCGAASVFLIREKE
jgi:MFS family permease